MTVNNDVLALLLPCIPQLQPGSPAIERRLNGKLYRMYLASHEDIHQYNLAEQLHFSGALIHESAHPFLTENGKDYYLVVEVFTLAPEYGSKGRYTFDDLCEYAGKLDKNRRAALKKLYARLNWSQLNDLTEDRLIERMDMALEVEIGRAHV